jgi:hypothetical protein
MVLYIIGDLLADRRQLKHLVLDDRIVGLLGKLPIHGRLIPKIIRPIHRVRRADRGSFRFHRHRELKHEIEENSCQKTGPRIAPRPPGGEHGEIDANESRNSAIPHIADLVRRRGDRLRLYGRDVGHLSWRPLSSKPRVTDPAPAFAVPNACPCGTD